MIMFIDFIKCELHHLIFFKLIMVFHGHISSKKKYGIGRKREKWILLPKAQGCHCQDESCRSTSG